MKTIKLLFLLLAFSAVTFYSCSDENPVNNTVKATQKSIALRTAVNEIKKANDISGKTNTTLTNPFCFEFVYPLSLSFNNATVVTVANFAGLIDVLASETSAFYLEGIHFPFQVTYGGSIHTISSENDFVSLIIMCGFNTINVDLHNTFCFDFVFPIAITVGDDAIQVFENAQELADYLNNPNNGSQSNLVFPLSVTYQGQVVVIHNIYEFYEMVNNCDNSCICTQEYAPVCIQTNSGVFEFGNMCYAICAGYSQNDLVTCNPSNECSIYDIELTPGACNNATYHLTINFSYVNVSGTQFTILTGTGQNLGSYPLSALPVTINNYPLTMATVDNLQIQIGNCVGYASWSTPNCICVCPTNFDPVCVQTTTGIVQYQNACFAQCEGHALNEFITCGVAPNNFGTQLGSCFYINYPVQIQTGGAIVTANNNGEVLQYWTPVTAMPQFSYPITVTFANTIHTFSNQAAFEAQIAASCH